MQMHHFKLHPPSCNMLSQSGGNFFSATIAGFLRQKKCLCNAQDVTERQGNVAQMKTLH